MARRGGRKAKKGKREPNGKLSRKNEHKQERRTIDEQSAMSVAIDARIRVNAVHPSHAGTDMAGTVVGRFFLAHLLEPEQLNAARFISDAYAAYQRVMDSPRPPKAVNIGQPTGGPPPDVSPERSARARGQWGEILGILQAANNIHRGAAIYASVDYVVLQNIDLPHLLPHLRLGLSAVAQAYRLAERAA